MSYLPGKCPVFLQTLGIADMMQALTISYYRSLKTRLDQPQTDFRHLFFKPAHSLACGHTVSRTHDAAYSLARDADLAVHIAHDMKIAHGMRLTMESGQLATGQ
jgi:hypothetical protein